MITFFKAAPTQAQLEAGNYPKGHRWFRNMRLTIENAKGTARKWRDADGTEGETEMKFDYGYIRGTHSTGDGEHVDCYIGPNEDAPNVYIVNQAVVGDWGKLDEQKVMMGFDSESDARAAYLAHYTDPRFLMSIKEMPFEEFRDKAHATLETPKMIKAAGPVVLFFKAHVGAYLRGGKMVNLNGYQGRSARTVASPGQMSLFGSNKPMGPSPFKGKDPVASTPDMFGDSPHGKTSIDHFKQLASDNPGFVRDALDRRLRAAGDDYEIRKIPHSDIQPLQQGEDYLNDSSRETARRIRSGDVLESRKEDVLPIRLSRDGKILDGHHRHAAAGLNGEKSMLALVPVGPGRGRIRNLDEFTQEAKPTHTEPTSELVAEHERLVDVLNSPSHADDKVEAKKQAKELGEYKEKPDKPVVFLKQPDQSSSNLSNNKPVETKQEMKMEVNYTTASGAKVAAKLVGTKIELIVNGKEFAFRKLEEDPKLGLVMETFDNAKITVPPDFAADVKALVGDRLKAIQAKAKGEYDGSYEQRRIARDRAVERVGGGDSV